MKQIIFPILLIVGLQLINSCQVEKIQPNELTDTITPPVLVEPEVPYTPPPCTLDSNKYKFSGVNYVASTVERDSASYSFDFPECTNSTFKITGSNGMNNNTINFYFIGEPKTGVYTTTASNILSEEEKNKVYLVISPSYNNNYTAEVGTLVYLKNDGKSIKISFCETPFKDTGSTFTVSNNYGQLVCY